jgi:hypothetical protein
MNLEDRSREEAGRPRAAMDTVALISAVNEMNSAPPLEEALRC